MNPLVKKEIRLLLPSFVVAVLLALVQGITRPYDFYLAPLLFFGLTIMALTTMGREASLNTFSMMLAQPAERMRIWQTKLSVGRRIFDCLCRVAGGLLLRLCPFPPGRL